MKAIRVTNTIRTNPNMITLMVTITLTRTVTTMTTTIITTITTATTTRRMTGTRKPTSTIGLSATRPETRSVDLA